MKIELKNIRYSAIASEETRYFDAAVYVDGKKAGTARNDGHGGATWIEPPELAKRINEYAATLPAVALRGLVNDDGTPIMVAQDAESLIDDLLDAFLNARDLRRWLSQKILFTKQGEEGLYETRRMGKEELARKLADPDALRARLPNCDRILNVMPFDEALAMMVKFG